MQPRRAIIIVVTCLYMLFYRPLIAADKPLAGIAYIKTNSPRTMTIGSFLEDTLVKSITASGIFNPLMPGQMREDLAKLECIDESCILGFAQNARINLIITGEFDDMNDFIILRLQAYGIDIPYQKKIVAAYSIKIPVSGKYGTMEFNALAEEHAGRFLSKLLRSYKAPAYFEAGADELPVISKNVSGIFSVYRAAAPVQEKTIRSITKLGTVRLLNGKVIDAHAAIQPGDFILSEFNEIAAILDKAVYERKCELSLKPSSLAETAYKVLLTGPASALMPLAAPFLGYYRNNDWEGITLWAFNVTPYLYLEINGLTDYFSNYYKKNKTIPRDVQAQYYFGLYMLCAGGASLFADAFAYTQLKKAAAYEGPQSFLGNSFSAGYLALISGGGGHFYRGRRLWGYLYYHVDNLLLFFSIREFCPDKKYNPLTRSFQQGRVDKTRAYSLLSITCAVKVGEIIHAVFIRDAILNGDLFEEPYSIEPVLYSIDGSSASWGLRLSYKF